MPGLRPVLTAAVAVSALGVAGLAHAGPQPVRPGETTSGLGLIGPKVPEILKTAKANTYAPPDGAVCEAAPQEIAALDEVLGPDADAPPGKTSAINPGKLITKAVRGMIPHKDVVRFLTQAGKKEKELSDAAMAGWARRGYLKGLVHTHCNGAMPTGGAAPTEQPQQQASMQTAPAADAAASNAAARAPAVDPAPLAVPPVETPTPTSPVAPLPQLIAASDNPAAQPSTTLAMDLAR